MRYVISDIHGHYEKFMLMLERIRFAKGDTLYILGDMVDRGDEPLKVVQHIMEMERVQVIGGNHEQLMLDVLREPTNELFLERWYRNGGEITHNQYKALPEHKQKEVRTYLEQLPTSITLPDYVLVHAGIWPPRKETTWEAIRKHQSQHDLIWIRGAFIDSPTYIDKKVVFGHTQTFKMDSPGKVWFGGDKIGIDCGVYSGHKGGRLGCLNLDTLETYYI